MAAGHREAARSVLDRGEHGANLGQAGHRDAARACSSLERVHEASISVRRRSGQLRPYVRPVARRSPLAIMGVRVRVRHQSVWRARGTRLLTGLPDPDYGVFPITLLRLPAGSVGFTPVACHPVGGVMRQLTPRPRSHPSDGRPPCASSQPRRCAPSCSPMRRSPIGQGGAAGQT